MSGDLERGYRRALRLLPGYYRRQWEEDMVAAFLESSLTGDPEEDEFVTEFGRPSWPEIASVAGLAARLYLGGAGAPRRYFAWGQAARRAVLVVMLAQAARALGSFMVLAWTHRLFGLPAPPARLTDRLWEGIWAPTFYTVDYAWIVVYIALVLGYYRTARVIAVLAIGPDLVYLLQTRLAPDQPSRPGEWAWWILLDLVPILAMAAFHRDAPPVTRRRWLLALPASCILVVVPVLAVDVTRYAHLLDFAGLGCILVTLACLAHAPGARSGRAGDSGVWSLTLILLATVAGIYRIAALGDYLHDPPMIAVGVVQLLVMAAAVALVAADGVRSQTAIPAPPHPAQ
jgi:hypothetical protein